MCGFVAFFSKTGTAVERAWVDGVLDTIEHRGPDDSGVHVEGSYGLGFRRLSILDLSPAGHQPMMSADGRFALVFNGEIYNYIELREELRSLGHVFRSSGDSEVLLAAYGQWGVKCVDRLRGMFAFCVVHRESGEVFAARDRFGIKPMYLQATPEGVMLASEIKAIRKAALREARPNVARFAQWLADGRMDALPNTTETFIEGIEQVMPGTSLRITPRGDVTHATYYSPEQVRENSQTSADEFGALLDDAIRLHLRSDVPIGVMLSGGMDSVSLTCRFSTLTGGPDARTQPIHAFCYTADDFDEMAQLQDTVRATGVTQHSVTDSSAEHFWGLLPKLIWHHDEPVHGTSALVGFDLYRLARSHNIRVVLSGQGADETLAGYPNFFDNMLVSLALSGRLPSLLQQATIIARERKLPRNSVLWFCAQLVRGTLMRGISPYRALSASRRTGRAPGLRMLTGDITTSLQPLQELCVDSRLGATLRRSITEYPLPMYLRVEDRNSMAHGIESRVPFLDHVVVEHVLQMPIEARLWDGWNKRALRDAMRGRIPDSVVSRRQKFGFPTGVRKWFSTSLASQLDELVLEGAGAKSGWVDVRQVRQILAEHRTGAADHSTMLFNLAQLSTWLDWHQRGWQ